jgi:PAS domain-containing protein
MAASTVALPVHDSSPGANWVVTDASGMLLGASPEAAEMLNLSVTGLRWRQLLVFFDGEREHWRRALSAAAGGLMVDCEGAVRPRDKRPLRVRAEIAQAEDRLNGHAVLWIFTEVEDHRARGRPKLLCFTRTAGCKGSDK